MRSIALALALAGCAAHDAEIDQAITNGTPATDDGVVGLVAGDAIYCSGVVIAPRVVLTAAHCLSAVTVGGVAFGGDRASAQIIGVAHARVHPDFDPTLLANDVGAIVLATPAPVTPVPRLDAPLVVGGAVELVGFGKTSAIDTSPAAKRRGTARLSSVGAHSFEVVADPSLTCAGDSGGAALVAGALAGIVSAGDGDCTRYSRSMRVDAYRAFVDDFVAATDVGAVPGARCYYAEQCALGECWFPADAPTIGYCATRCDDDDDCVRGTECVDTRCRYAAPSPGALGASCTSYSDCDSRLCSAGTCSGAFPTESAGCAAVPEAGFAFVVLLVGLSLRRYSRVALRA